MTIVKQSEGLPEIIEIELEQLPFNSPARLPLLYRLITAISDTDRVKSLLLWQGIYDIAKQNDLHIDAARALINTGAHYFWASDWTKALSCFNQASDLSEQINDRALLAKAYVNSGAVYGESGDHAKAIEIFKNAAEMFEELEQDEAAFVCRINIAATLPHLGETEESSKILLELVSILNSKNSWAEQNYRQASVNRQLAKNYLELGKSTESYDLYLNAKSGFEKGGAHFSDVSACVNGMANCLLLSGQFEKAIDTLNHEFVEQESSIKHVAEKYRLLSECYEKMKQWEPAFDSLKKFKYHTEELKRSETSKKLAELEFKKEVIEKQKEAEIEHLRNVELKKEKDRSEALLLNILPAEVAEELKEKGSAEAKLFDEVTVLFTDFKSFTKVSEKMTPQELVNELNECFKGFDEIISRYNIEKIKTMGDGFIAAAGLPAANAKHAEDMVNAALEICNFMVERKKKLGNKTFEVRIGLHSGSVVAGIVGVKKFAYDIWGDTVNTAARMEQSGEPGKVNISHTTYDLVKDKFKCKYRGEHEAKNKGKMKMYFVE